MYDHWPGAWASLCHAWISYGFRNNIMNEDGYNFTADNFEQAHSTVEQASVGLSKLYKICLLFVYSRSCVLYHFYCLAIIGSCLPEHYYVLSLHWLDKYYGNTNIRELSWEIILLGILYILWFEFGSNFFTFQQMIMICHDLSRKKCCKMAN